MKVKRLSSVILISSMWILFGVWLYIENLYITTRPHVPSPSEGRNYPLNVHGTIVYLTKSEDSVVQGLFFGALGCGVIGGLLWRRKVVA